MTQTHLPTAPSCRDALPLEFLELRSRVRAQPAQVRSELEPLLEEVLEHARFRSRIMTVARDALERLRLDLELTRFDLDATRRERERLRQRLGERGDA
jgi:nitric oxide reductase activation protein